MYLIGCSVLVEFQDYVRAGAVSPSSPDILLSGSYDRSVKMYDTRTNSQVVSVDHGAPVESILFLPSGGIFLSAGNKILFSFFFKHTLLPSIHSIL